MTLGLQRALLWICACHFQLIFAARPSKELLGVLSSGEDERGNHSLAAGGKHNPFGAGLHGPDQCQVQKRATHMILTGLGVSFNQSGDHCSWPGITCSDCFVVGIELAGRLGQVSGSLSETWRYLQELEVVDLSNTKLTGDIVWFSSSWLPNLNTVKLDFTQVHGDIRAFNHDGLKFLSLRSTWVSGDIKAFESSRNLRALHLSGTQVGGDIETLQANRDLPGCALRDIDLSNTRVGGDIRAVQAFPDLIHLNLQNTLVFGDISAFEATRYLQDLHLPFTRAFGDIKAFRRTKDLKRLRLSLSQVSGDIQVFQHTPGLILLLLDATQVEGDIKVFEHLQRVLGVRLSSTMVRGDIAVFSAPRKMAFLALSDTQVSGDLQAFANTSLGTLQLRKTLVRGNLSALQSATGLQNLDLSATLVQGDIRVFESTTMLLNIVLSSTELTGDVAVFHRNHDLQKVDLSYTHMSGDIQVFKGQAQLKTLKMASTRTWGNLQVLMKEGVVNVFETIDLSNTKVEGNLFVLKHAVALKEIYLQGTQVAGSIDGIVGWKKASVVDLSRTSVTGRLTEKWRGCCKHLRTLKLSDSRAEFLPVGTDFVKLIDLRDAHWEVLLPALTTLEVSGCPLNGRLQDLVLPLAYCEHLGSIIAVNCGLSGEMPNLDPLAPTRVNGFLEVGQRSKLASSLEVLELSGNNLSFFESIPPSIRKLVVSSNKGPLRLAEGAVPLALRNGVAMDLRGTTLHNETRQEAKRLLRDNLFHRTLERTFSSREREGYTCYDLDRSRTTLEVTPPEFLPEELCACLPGWHGKGASCNKCPENTFKPVQGEQRCTQCPQNTSTNNRQGCVEESDCRACRAFRAPKKGETDDMVCECPAGSAVFDNRECLECFAPKKRCIGGPGASSTSHCAKGYDGPLCMRCSDDYYATGGWCVECKSKRLSPWLIKAAAYASISALLLLFILAIGFFVYSWSPSKWLEEKVKAVMDAAAGLIFASGDLGKWQQQLAKRQAPILLQMCQLWSVMSALVGRADDKASNGSFSSFWELPYVEQLQLAIGSTRELLYLQCFFGGAKVRLMLALVAPVVPLILLLCCVLVEVWKPGTGVNAALKILTVFFIGGASKCAALISCQRVDAGGWPLQPNMTFVRQLPDLTCDPKRMVLQEVEQVFWPCAICYGILIPAFLFYLYARQHLVLRYKRMPLELASEQDEDLAVSHQDVKLQLQRRLVAGLVAYVSILQHGSVRVELKDDKGTVRFLDKPDGTALQIDEKAAKAQFKEESQKLRHNAITEMLLERQVLEELGEKDRFLFGAKETLFKYSACRDLWMEVMLKLVTVVMVQAVASNTGVGDLIPWGKVMAATLAVAATVLLLHPYAQPQVNNLQICCFTSLAVAATGFSMQNAWISRTALLAPFLLAAAQHMQPDSPESLAQRLWEALVEDGVPKKSATTAILTRREPLQISFTLEHS